jgi:hypothetical protein
MGPIGNDLGSIAAIVAVLRQSSEAGGGVKQITDKLRRQADVFTELTDLQCRVGLDPIEGRTTRLLNFNLISRAELSNGDVEASSASPERSPRAMRVEVGSGISDGEWLCCIRR